MDTIYSQIIDQIVASGKRIRAKAGKIRDVGIAKQHLTEEDVRIERELKEIVLRHDPAHAFYAEEENQDFSDAEDVWAVDPISGTRFFILGLPHYGIVAAHLRRGVAQFAAVYDPSMDELYTATRNGGAFLNGEKISVAPPGRDPPKIVFDLSSGWPDAVLAQRMLAALSTFDLYRLAGSHAVNDGLVARGKFHGLVCLAKDSFPYFATSLIVQEAGGLFTNLAGDASIKPTDRVFVGGEPQTYRRLMTVVEGVFRQS
jgi:myo-inositol-1(or 4)-monophosphatase